MDLWFQIFLAILILSIPFLLVILLSNSNKPQKFFNKKLTPPSPRRLPIIGNLHQLDHGQPPHLSLQNLMEQHEPIMLLHLGSVRTLVVSSADMANELFRSHDLAFSGRPLLYAAKKLSYGLMDIAFAPYGNYWKEMRKIVVLELLSIKKVQSFQVVRDKEVALMLDAIAHSPSKVVNLSKLALTLANNVTCKVAFGKTFNKENATNAGFYELMREMQRLLAEANIADFYPWFGSIVNKFNGFDKRLEKCFRALDGFFDGLIKDHLQQERRGHQEDLVDVLLRLQRDPNQAITLTNEQIKGVLIDVLIAGSDTSAAVIEWTMTELIRNPRILKRVQDEVREVAKAKQTVSHSELRNLSYLKQVLKESLRLHPPAPLLVPRETIEDSALGGYHIPAKTRVLVNARAIGRDPNHWGSDSDRFMPERFADETADIVGQHSGFIPFGAGRRSCPGTDFAVALVELAVANLLHWFDWELPGGIERDEVDMEEDAGLTAHKKKPLELVARPRKGQVGPRQEEEKWASPTILMEWKD